MQLKYGNLSRVIFSACADTVLGAVKKIEKKATISFVMSVSPSIRPAVRLEKLGPQ